MYPLQIVISAENLYVKNIPAGAGIAEKCHAPLASVIVGSMTPLTGTGTTKPIAMDRSHGATVQGPDELATTGCFMPSSTA